MYGGHLTNTFNRHIYDNYMTLNIYGTLYFKYCRVEKEEFDEEKVEKEEFEEEKVEEEVALQSHQGNQSRC